MAEYTSIYNTPPTESNFLIGDTVTLASGDVWKYAGNGRWAVTEMSVVKSLVASGGRVGAVLQAMLDSESLSTGIQVLGDSTGNDVTEWPTLLARALAAANKQWSVKVRLFSDSAQSYGAPVIIQTGPLGERYLDGSTGIRPRRLAATLSPHLSGTIDFRARMRLANWVPGAQVNVGGKSGAAGARGWYACRSSSGR
jgi:hypothetical protein